jgi:hypothetical protein
MELTAIRRRTTVPNRWLAKLSPLGMPVSVSRYELGEDRGQSDAELDTYCNEEAPWK